MAKDPSKPRSRSRRKAAEPSPPASADASETVAVLDEAAEKPTKGGRSRPRKGEAAIVPADPTLPFDEERAERMVKELAELADEASPEPDDDVQEERIRSVQELLALGAGEVELLLFRIGAEFFAFDLAAAEEAVELDSVHAVPDMPDAMLGVFDLRGRLIPVYSPADLLCKPDNPTSGVLLLMRTGERRVGIVVDDVEDVVVLEYGMLRRPPAADNDGLVLGVAFFGETLVTVLDAHALVAACAAPATAEVA